MTYSDINNPRWQQRQKVLKALEANLKRRQKAEGMVHDARVELADLLEQGKALPWALKVAEMARAADISRETAHKLIRRRDES